MIRAAIVGSGTRNPRAISAVVSPPTSRRVSATRDSGARAGWQQVNSSRSWSSRTAPTSSTSSSAPARNRATSASFAVPTASRRSLSTARFRAVVMTQPAGDGGTPRSGQVAAAAA